MPWDSLTLEIQTLISAIQMSVRTKMSPKDTATISDRGFGIAKVELFVIANYSANDICHLA